MPAQEGATGRPRALAACGLALICGAICFLAFLPALGAELVNLDDDWNLAFNPSFQGLSAQHLEWMLTTSSPMGHYQPLTWLSYALDFVLFGHAAAGYHRTSVLLHCGVAVLFYWLASTLFGALRRRAGALDGASSATIHLAAALAALLFAVHPLRVESVAWATGRNDLLSGGFAVLAAIAWLRYGEQSGCARWRSRDVLVALGLAFVALSLCVSSLDLSQPGTLALRPFGGALLGIGALCLALLVAFTLRARGQLSARRSSAYAGATLFLLLSFLCKPWAIGLPLVFLVVDAWMLRRMEPADGGEALSRGRAWTDLLLEKLPLFVLCGVFAAIASWAKRDLPILVKTDQTLVERIGQAFYGLAFYPLATLWPSGLVPIRDLPDEIRIGAPRFLFAALGVLCCAAALALLRKRASAVAVAFASYALLIAPALGLVQFNTLLVADRYGYVACMPFALLAGGGWLVAASRRLVGRELLAALPIAAIAALSAATWRQSAVWRTSETLWLHSLRHGESSRALVNLAAYYNQQSYADPARREAWLERARPLATRALELARSSGLYEPEYRLTLGTVLLNRGELDAAIDELEAFVAEKPGFAQGRINLGLALVRAGRFARARTILERAVELAGTDASAWRLLGLAREGEGDRESALAAYRRALELDPDNATARERVRALSEGR